MKKLNKLWLLPIAGLMWASVALHDYHVGIFDIAYNSDEQTLQLSEKIFIDDLEKALAESGIREDLHIGSEKEHADADKYISKYLSTHLQLYMDGKQLEQHYIGKEWEDHHTLWCYLEVKDVKEVKSLKITNTVFTHMFDDQQNIHNISVNGEKKSVVLTRTDLEATVEF